MVRQTDRLTKNPGPWHREMQDLGYNYRMTGMQAALGLSQLKKADFFLRRRREIADRYSSVFRGFEQLIIPEAPDGAVPSWDFYPLRLFADRFPAGRGEVFEAIIGENIGLDVKYLPIHLQPYYLWIGHPDVCTIEDSLCPEAEGVYNSLLCLPVYPSMNDRDVEDVIRAVIKTVQYFSL